MKVSATTKILFALFFSVLFTLSTPSFCAQRNFFKDNVTYTVDNPPVIDDVTSFEQLGIKSAIKLQGNLSKQSIGFGSRLDELVTAAKIDVSYIYSPTLSEDVTQVRVLINNQVAGYFSVDRSKAGTQIKNTMHFDPRLLSKYNEITFELITYREERCANQAQMSEWFEISKQSQLVLTVQPIPLKNDLSLFPKPFFDVNDFTLVEIPFIFPENSKNETLEPAGIAASYFGSLAKWRVISFPTLTNQLPTKHAIVFATNDKRPDFLKDLPPVSKPTIQLIAHPTNPFVKLLLILGRDKQDLRTAIEGLVTGSPILAGSFAEITNVNILLPRKPYDAPSWMPLDREVKLGELVETPTQLQTHGRTPTPIILNFNIAPDLFTWKSRGIPINIKYRYSPPNKEDDSQLSMFVNDLFIKGFSLNKNGISGESDNDRVRVPLIDDLVFGEENRILVPGFRLSTRNRIQFEYSFNKPEGGDCRDLTADYMYGEVDGDSTIDLSGFYHYMPMPDLRSFSNLGFPFTRLADLADTGVILNKNASESEVETYLELLGSFGSSTGLSATKFTIFDSAPYNGIEDKDILVIGQLSTQIVQENDKNKLANVLVSEMKKAITQPIRNAENTEIFQPNYIKSERTVTSQIEFNNNSDNEVGALLSFESPWQKNRSVVALVASHPSSFKQIISTIMNRNQVVSGSVSLFRAGEVVNVQVGETYFIGYLPIYKLIWFELSDHPILVGLITFLMVILLITTLWRLFKYIAYKRLKTSR